MKDLKKQRRIRKTVQILWGFITNAHLSGFITGRIYSGPLKSICVPGMNCYACPGALGACPIGSLSSMLSARKSKFAFYVVGFMAMAGILAGRFICGWLCLFGLIQEFLYKIPIKKIHIPEKADKWLRYLKYVILVVFVVLLPVILRDEYGLSAPYFCQLICPVGTLEGGIPLVLLDEGIRQAAHFLFTWKLIILGMIIAASIVIHRPFCKYICPLGAFYALFQRFSFLRLNIDRNVCISCGSCKKICKMQVDPSKLPNSAECIRCGECTRSCPVNALQFTFAGKSFKRCQKEQPTQKIQ